MNVSVYQNQSHNLQLHDDDEDVFATSLIDRYAARLHALQNICLATFAVMYDVIQSSTMTGETWDVNTERDMQNTENADALTKMKLQKGIRCHQAEETAGNTTYKKVQIHTEPEKYYHSKLLLYYPWNEEDDIISTYQSYHDSYMSKQDIIHQNTQKSNDDCVAFDIDLQDLENNTPQSAWEMVAPKIAQDDRTTNVQGFYTLKNQKPGKEVTIDTVSHDNTRNTTDTLCTLYAKAAKKVTKFFSVVQGI